MTREEVSRCYQIPMDVLSIYERWNLRGKGAKEQEKQSYDEKDLQKLSTMMTLFGVGFEKNQVECYMRLAEKEDAAAKQKDMLEQKRNELLEHIHELESEIEKLDYLRYQIRS